MTEQDIESILPEPKRNIAEDDRLTPLPPEPDPNKPLKLQPPIHTVRRVRLPKTNPETKED